MSPDDFIILCRFELDFLVVDYECVRLPDYAKALLIEVPYENGFVRLTTSLDIRDQYVQTNFDCIQGSRNYGTGQRGFSFGLAALLEVVAPSVELYPSGWTGRVLTDAEMREVVHIQSESVKSYAGDILTGDFSIVPAIVAAIRKHMI